MKQFEQPKTTTRDEALPCPFCGEQPEIEWWHGGGPDKHMVSCVGEECGPGPSVSGETYGAALAAWNTRAA